LHNNNSDTSVHNNHNSTKHSKKKEKKSKAKEAIEAPKVPEKKEEFVLKPKKATSPWIYFNNEMVAKLKSEKGMD
jgi:hypothetical protein